MNRTELLDALKEFTKTATKELILPVRVQKNNPEAMPRAAEVYKMRLPDSKSSKDKAPYILHQVITGKDVQPTGQPVDCRTTIRSIFVVYCEDEQEGGLNLLNLMERLRIALLQQHVIGKKYELNLQEGVETLIYPDDTAPYFMGEMVTVWNLPPVQREVSFI